jgi:hypothetical protein
MRLRSVVDGELVNIPILGSSRYRGTKKAKLARYWLLV